jgi:hypothetical protein
MSYENQISELYFLLHTCNLHEIGSRLKNLLQSLKKDLSKQNIRKESLLYLKTLYLLIGYTRDIYFGHGERDVAYMMLFIWYSFFPVLAIYAIHRFFDTYGSWNDIKYFCKFISRVSNRGIDDPFIDIAIACANRQLYSDQMLLDTLPIIPTLSNVSKWIPRENKMGWLFEKCVLDWSNQYQDDDLDFSYQKKLYRQMVSKLSNYIDPITNKYLFTSLSNDIDTVYRYSSNKYFHDNVFIGTFIQSALSILQKNNVNIETCPQANWLHKKWSRLCSSFMKCSHSIPMIDVSADMSDDALYHAIGFACLIAIRSGIFRILLVCKTPIWIECSEKDNLCSLVQKIWPFCQFRTRSHFSLAFDLIFDAAAVTLSSDLKLFIFSNKFAFDWSNTIQRFEDKNLIFWNIGSKYSAFSMNPTMDFHMNDHKNAIFLSGISPALFSKFCITYNGSPTLSPRIESSYAFLFNSLHSERYASLAQYFDQSIISSGCDV